MCDPKVFDIFFSSMRKVLEVTSTFCTGLMSSSILVFFYFIVHSQFGHSRVFSNIHALSNFLWIGSRQMQITEKGSSESGSKTHGDRYKLLRKRGIYKVQNKKGRIRGKRKPIKLW